MACRLNKLICLLMVASLACSQQDAIGYYEPDREIMDEEISHSFDADKYHLVKQDFTADQLKTLEAILENEALHLLSDLGTCEISGVLVLTDKTIYLTCGTAQLFISDSEGVKKIMLTGDGNHQLFELVRELRK